MYFIYGEQERNANYLGDQGNIHPLQLVGLNYVLQLFKQDNKEYTCIF